MFGCFTIEYSTPNLHRLCRFLLSLLSSCTTTLGTLCQSELENKVAAVRIAAVEVMGALYYQIGPRLNALAIADDMKPALRVLLEAEFAKVRYTKMEIYICSCVVY